MAIRFRRSIRIAKGVRLNIGKRGLGLSAGPRGARVSVGPRGARGSVGIPGTGVSYSRGLRGGRSGGPQHAAMVAPPQHAVRAPSLHVPLFASRETKEFVRGLNAFAGGDADGALRHLEPLAEDEPAAAFLVATVLHNRDEADPRAAALLEGVLASEEFPTPLAEKYLAKATVGFRVTPSVTATLPMDATCAAMVLAEVYQAQGREEDAIALVEELLEASQDPLMRLSLAELYGSKRMWDAVQEVAEGVAAEDDVTLETVTLHARALHEQGLHDAAVARVTDAVRKKKGRDPDLLNEALYVRAVALEASGKRARARKEIEKLYAAAPGLHDVKTRVEAYASVADAGDAAGAADADAPVDEE